MNVVFCAQRTLTLTLITLLHPQSDVLLLSVPLLEEFYYPFPTGSSAFSCIYLGTFTPL